MNSKALYITSLLLFIFYTNAQETISYSGDTTTAIDTTYTDVSISTFLSTTSFTTQTTTVSSCTPAQELFDESGGISMDKADDTFQYLCFPVDVPINNEKVNCVYIYINGMVSTSPQYSYEPRTLTADDAYTFAPFWSDIDIRIFGSVTYKEIEKYPISREISINDGKLLKNLNKFIRKKRKVEFDTVYALIVTWRDVIPHLANTTDKSVTFQLVLVTDGTTTYVVYIYDTCNMSWDFQLNVMMGHSTDQYNIYNNIYSLTDNIITQSLLLGNNGEGTWLFLVSSDSPENYKLECLKWHWDNIGVNLINSNEMAQCPCSVDLLSNNVNFYYNSLNKCYQIVVKFNGIGKTCCYDEQTGALTRGNLEKNLYNEVDWATQDYLPYQHCCVNSGYCDVFHQNRPRDDCSLWQQDPIAFMFGDPHFRTMDGVNYTFNGYGEFQLLNIFNNSNDAQIMKIQCRTRKIESGEGTVFEAFAFETQETHVQVMTSLNAKNVVVSVNKQELTQFRNVTNAELQRPGVFIRKMSSNPEVYWFTFSNGITANITFVNEILQFGLGLPLTRSSIYTNGLLGTFNGNKSDDFQLPDKSYIAIDSDEETIYRRFGSLWAINSSIFQYENGRNASYYQNPDYVPTFWSNDLTTNATVNNFCDGQKSCIFDYTMTQSWAIAQDTREVLKEVAVVELLEQYPTPKINGSKDVYLFKGNTRVFEFNIIYDKLNISLEVVENSSCVITMSNDIVKVNLTENGSNISAAFRITSDKGHKTELFKLRIIVCPECVNGTCEAEKEFQTTFTGTRYLNCSCNTGWKGENCSEDNRCAPFPCRVSTPEKCECKCPEGYEYKDDKCVEIDECSNGSPCGQLCTNTAGSYTCSCKPGYVRIGKNCTDINECEEQHGCEQKCNNTDGSYTCSCYNGYTLNANGMTCDKDPSLNCSTCSNHDGCKMNGSSIECFCKMGYNYTPAGCEDLDECKLKKDICGNATCTNLNPGYKCECNIGYTYDRSENLCVECPRNKWGPNCNNECNAVFCTSCDKEKGCTCELGKKGENCSVDIDECKTVNPCDNSTTTCQNTDGSYFCKCKAGYKKNSDIRCKDIDECEIKNHACSEFAICTNTVGSYRCTCKEGFIGNGYNCTDINECESDNKCSHMCNNTEGSYACTCREGYYIADDRFLCIYNGKDNCQSEENKCSENAKCTSWNEFYNCTCNDGFEGDGFSCTATHDYFDEQKIYIIVGIIMGLLVWLILMIFCVWCCCFGGYRRHRSRHETLASTLDYDPYNVNQGFGSLTSSFAGRRGGRYYFGKFLGTKYLRNWAEFSPDAGDDPIPGTSAESINEEASNIKDSRWKRVLERVNKTEVFHIDRPEISTRSYYT